MKKIKIRGLAVNAGWICAIWGAIVAVKGLYDAFIGEPEANLFSPSKWEFVSRQQWFTWSGFEVTYGMACLGASYLLWMYSRRLPEYIERA